MEAVFICARTKKLFCLKFSYREQAPSHIRLHSKIDTRSNVGGSLLPMTIAHQHKTPAYRPGHVLLSPPNLTNYPPWNATNCGRGLAPDSNGPATTKLQPKKMPQPIDRGISY